MKEMGRSSAMTGGVSCQQAVDAKAFKGKGSLRLVRALSRDVDSLHEQMRELVETTMQVPGLLMYLCVHHRKATGQRSLRWRASGGAAKHLSWQEADEMCRALPVRTAEWYADVTRRALLLNDLEKHARPKLRAARTAAGLDADGVPEGQGDLFEAEGS